MRLFDAPIGIFRFDGELVLKTEYYSENKRSGKYIPDCYIVRTGEYFLGGAKTANEFINFDVEPADFAELLPTVTDTITKQAAIDALDKRFDSIPMEQTTEILLLRKDLRELPSAEPKIIYCKDCCKHNKLLGDYEIPYGGSDGHWIFKPDACPLAEFRGKARGHEFDYQFCALGERRTE